MAGDVKAALGEASAGALTLTDSHAIHPTEIVIDLLYMGYGKTALPNFPSAYLFAY